MTNGRKPAFLKTFSEYTIAELRRKPLADVFSLFLSEIGLTFTTRRVHKKRKVTTNHVEPKKNSTEHSRKLHFHIRLPKFRFPRLPIPALSFKLPQIAVPKIHLALPKITFPNVSSALLPKVTIRIHRHELHQAMKRVFTLGPVEKYRLRKPEVVNDNAKKNETVVFTNPTVDRVSTR